ncbi:MAG: gamma-glutamyl-gamma-aminobutyrate hydrolase family protein [Candidatus Lokiarchaeota archaeon]|nr:gamma-glutamyl-gamma-aminobutyrate hydrolase family protein [Candidatus Lokiarchaeota archaeon]
MVKPPIILVDFGSKYTKYIIRSLERLTIRYVMLSANKEKPEGDELFKEIQAQPKIGIILSGSHDNLYEPKARRLPHEFIPYLIATKIPTMGICYGHQIIVYLCGGKIVKNPLGLEKGHLVFSQTRSNYPLFKDLPKQFKVKMHHYDVIEQLPPNCLFQNFGKTDKTQYGAIQMVLEDKPLPIFGIQLHPEKCSRVINQVIFRNFYAICNNSSKE